MDRTCRVTCLVVSVQSVHLVPVHSDGVALALTHVPVTHLGIIIIIITIIIIIITWSMYCSSRLLSCFSVRLCLVLISSSELESDVELADFFLAGLGGLWAFIHR